MGFKFLRRDWMRTASNAAIGSILPNGWSATVSSNRLSASKLSGPGGPDYEKPLFNLHAQLAEPVTIDSIELLKRGSKYFVRTRSEAGAETVMHIK